MWEKNFLIDNKLFIYRRTIGHGFDVGIYWWCPCLPSCFESVFLPGLFLMVTLSACLCWPVNLCFPLSFCLPFWPVLAFLSVCCLVCFIVDLPVCFPACFMLTCFLFLLYCLVWWWPLCLLTVNPCSTGWFSKVFNPWFCPFQCTAL